MASTKVHFIFLATGPGDHHSVCACNIGELETIGEKQKESWVLSIFVVWRTKKMARLLIVPIKYNDKKFMIVANGSRGVPQSS